MSPRYWTTTSVNTDRAFAFWVDTVCSELVELEVKTDRKRDFQASMLQKALGCVSLNFIDTRAPQDAWRTRESIRRTREPRFDLLYVRTGTLHFEHYGRSFIVGDNQCVLIDSTETYHFTTPEVSTSTSVQIPQKWLRSWIANPEEGVARVFTRDCPWGNTLIAMLDALTPETTQQLVLADEVVAEQVASLLALAIGRAPIDLNRNQSKLVTRIRQQMQEQAHDETLTPEGIAQALGISKRYLHSLFAAAGTTFCKELMSLRLERAARQLRDPQFTSVSVSEIAWRCGFTDSSHFARRFCQRYGTPPREYRRSVLS
jgi:AraC-like DNA-binding protein